MVKSTTVDNQSEGEQIKSVEKNKIPVSIQQQIVQGLTAQQLQNIKNVTLLRANSPANSIQTSGDSQDGGQSNMSKINHTEVSHCVSSY